MNNFYTELKEFIDGIDQESSNYTIDYFEDLRLFEIYEKDYTETDLKIFIGSSLYTVETLLTIIDKNLTKDIKIFEEYINFLNKWNNIYNIKNYNSDEELLNYDES
jgi:hypothetical protein